MYIYVLFSRGATVDATRGRRLSLPPQREGVAAHHFFFFCAKIEKIRVNIEVYIHHTRGLRIYRVFYRVYGERMVHL